MTVRADVQVVKHSTYSVVALVFATCISLVGCGGAPPTSSLSAHASGGPVPPSVSPLHCARDRAAPQLDVPDADSVARTPWRLEQVGSCAVPAGDGRSNVSFMEGWAGLPADCNGQGAQFESKGRLFILNPDEVGSTAAGCTNGDVPIGNLGAVTSWGIAKSGWLYLLDPDEQVVFVVAPTAAPGCIASVPGEPHSRRLAPIGDPDCRPMGRAG